MQKPRSTAFSELAENKKAGHNPSISNCLFCTNFMMHNQNKQAKQKNPKKCIDITAKNVYNMLIHLNESVT